METGGVKRLIVDNKPYRFCMGKMTGQNSQKRPESVLETTDDYHHALRLKITLGFYIA